MVGVNVQRYVVDPTRSTVRIDASSTLHPIRETARGLEGWVDVADGHLVDAEISFRVRNLRSGNPLQDRELLRRIEARKFPTIEGRVTHVDGVVTGDITFRGVRRTVTDDLDLEVRDDGVVITGSASLDLRNWDFEPPRILALRVSPDVRVSIEVHAAPAP